MKKLLFLLFCFPIFFVNKINAYQVLDNETFEMATGQSGENQGDEVDQKDVEAGGGVALSGRKKKKKSFKSNQVKTVTWASPEKSSSTQVGYAKGYTRIYQTLTINHNNNLEVEENGNEFSLKANSEEDWEFVGGEQGSPLAFWLDSETTLEDIKNDPDNFYKSRYLEYTMICENLSCDVISKPSYLKLEKSFFDGKECIFDFSYNDDSPQGEEFEIKAKQRYRCQLLVNDQYRDQQLTMVKDQNLAKDVIQAKVSDYKDYFIQATSHGSDENYTNYGYLSEYIEKEEEFSYVAVVPSLANSKKNQTVGSDLQTNNLLLESLFVDSNQLKPEFNSNYFYYQVELDKIASSSPKIIASAYDSDNQVTIDSPLDINSDKKEERTAYINVIAPNNKSRKTYTIDFSYKKQKNYLLSLSSTLAVLNPEFSKYKNHYQIDLSKKKELFVDNQSIETILKSVKANSENSSDKITIMPVEFKPNQSVTVLISLISSDKLKSNQYYLTFFADERMWYF